MNEVNLLIECCDIIFLPGCMNCYTDINELVVDLTVKNQNNVTLFTAIEKKTSRKVIIKKINLQNDDLHEFLIESNVLRNVSHQHIIKPIEIMNDTFYGTIVIPFAEGGDLYGAICQKDWSITNDQLKIFTYNLFSALSTFHKSGFVHRDLKPENIVLTATNFDPNMFLIIDLASSYCENMCKHNNINIHHFRTSVIYTPPEYFYWGISSEKYDIWSVGMILYLMVVQSLPFYINEMHPDYLKFYLSKKDVLFYDERWKYISDEMKDLIYSLFEFNMNHRPTANDVLNNPIFSSM
ncbi:CAMK family protein kinase [Tritrichomonas foetus]|uniref:CAMK family protein kinase n=1 Tax=Tritrichomonas foetus TaxID=1144522 RepID=A0A1J4KRL8_9EUKA|nr:CAMK family protein kinase [Tritrichomonas foetus]|eukprot:OHT13937.1 CAMK family protein kinase [Tritrichomonas foetus]